MANIQEEASKIVEKIQRENKQKTVLANTILAGSKNEMDKFIETQKRLAEIQNGEYSEAEIAYLKSPYYDKYELVLKQLDTSLILVLNQLSNQYQLNIQYYQDPTKLLASVFHIQGIGYPIPERFTEELKQTINQKINEYSSNYDFLFENRIIDIVITPREYIGKDNFIKKIDAYEVMISLKEKTKTK